MDELNLLAQDFACTSGSNAPDIIGILAAKRAGAARSQIGATAVEGGQPQLSEALQAIRLPESMAWRPEIGLAESIHRRADALVRAALQWALASFIPGQIGSFRCTLPAPAPIFIDGYLINVSGEVMVRAQDQTLTLVDDHGESVFRQQGSVWALLSDAGRELAWEVGHVRADRSVYVARTLTASATHGFPWPWFDGVPIARRHQDVAGAEAHAVVAGAYDVLRAIGGETDAWVRGALSGLLLLQGKGLNTGRASSSADFPGLLALDPPMDAVHCAELIVHEASRQYANAFLLVASLLEEGREAAFYSPLKRSYETFGRVLLGAHAVGNVLLFYAQLERVQELNEAATDRRDILKIWFESHYMRALDSCAVLTPAGQRFWRTLRSSLMETDTFSHRRVSAGV